MHPAGALSKAPLCFDTSSGYRISRSAAPSRRGLPRQWLVLTRQRSSPDTAAGPPRSCTVFRLSNQLEPAFSTPPKPLSTAAELARQRNHRNSSALGHEEITADAIAQFVDTIHEIDQILVETFGQDVIDSSVVNL